MTLSAKISICEDILLHFLTTSIYPLRWCLIFDSWVMEKYSNFLFVCWSLAKILPNFLSLSLKLVNTYYPILSLWKGSCLVYCLKIFEVRFRTPLSNLKKSPCQNAFSTCLSDLIHFNNYNIGKTNLDSKPWSKVRNGILPPKLFWPTARKKKSSDREKLLILRLKAKNLQNFWDH